MNRDDEAAISTAAENRRSRAREQNEMDARKAELPRTHAEDARERWQWFGRLISRVARRLAR